MARVQCHMVEECKYNYKNQYNNNLKCNVCQINDCTQKHLLECPVLIGSINLVTYIPQYDDTRNSGRSAPLFLAPAVGWEPLGSL